MPTSRPRYVVTDTGDVRMLLDDAAKAWPDVGSRKQQDAALARAGARVDVAALLDDAAWR